MSRGDSQSDASFTARLAANRGIAVRIVSRTRSSQAVGTPRTVAVVEHGDNLLLEPAPARATSSGGGRLVVEAQELRIARRVLQTLGLDEVQEQHRIVIRKAPQGIIEIVGRLRGPERSSHQRS